MVTRDNNDAESTIGSVACRIIIQDAASSWDAPDALARDASIIPLLKQ